MNPTSLYWTPEVIYKGVKSQAFKERQLGFQFDIPYPDPVTAGFYDGENPTAGRNELVFSNQPEIFAVQNIIPSVGGIPRFNPYNKLAHFKRSDVTHKFPGN